MIKPHTASTQKSIRSRVPEVADRVEGQRDDADVFVGCGLPGEVFPRPDGEVKAMIRGGVSWNGRGGGCGYCCIEGAAVAISYLYFVEETAVFTWKCCWGVTKRSRSLHLQLAHLWW